MIDRKKDHSAAQACPNYEKPLFGYGPPPFDLEVSPGCYYLDLSTGDYFQQELDGHPPHHCWFDAMLEDCGSIEKAKARALALAGNARIIGAPDAQGPS